MKFHQEKEIVFEIWEEDINEHDLLFTEKVEVKNLQAKGQLILPLKSEEKKKEGSLSLKYETKNVVEKKGEKKEEKKISERK